MVKVLSERKLWDSNEHLCVDGEIPEHRKLHFFFFFLDRVSSEAVFNTII